MTTKLRLTNKEINDMVERRRELPQGQKAVGVTDFVVSMIIVAMVFAGVTFAVMKHQQRQIDFLDARVTNLEFAR